MSTRPHVPASGRGETHDATFVWLPERRVLASGDFVIWVFPNAGNPRKVAGIEVIDAADEEFRVVVLRCQIGLSRICVRHLYRMQNRVEAGAPVEERERFTHEMLERLCPVAQHLGRALLAKDDRTVTGNEDRRMQRYAADWATALRRMEALARFDGDAAHLKPPRTADLASELAALAGGAEKLAERATHLSEAGNFRLAVQLVEFASAAAPDDRAIQATRAAVLRKSIENENSLMGKAFLAVYAREAEQRSKG